MLEHLSDYNILLASKSPRRKELLSGLDIPFEQFVPFEVEESYPHHLQKQEIPLYLCRKKAEAFLPEISDKDILITADTIVWCQGKVLEKPNNREQAFEMLTFLTEKTHQVFTGVCITVGQKIAQTFFVATEVTFGSLTETEKNYYLDKYRPYDKAGSYGVQEWIGYIGVSSINGSFYNVMGLPVQKLYQELKNISL